jgi:hypothetical protein
MGTASQEYYRKCPYINSPIFSNYFFPLFIDGLCIALSSPFSFILFLPLSFSPHFTCMLIADCFTFGLVAARGKERVLIVT